jgi:creatinine amidohydrolase
MPPPLPTGPLCWEDLTWPEIEDLLRHRPHELAVLPVGATEQHGPHLPTGTDTIIANGLCHAVSALTGALVLPPITIGCSYGHGTSFPGTLSFSPEQLARAVQDVV